MSTVTFLHAFVQLSFEGIRGGDWASDIAIDDIGLEDDCCSGNTSASCKLCSTYLYIAGDVRW